MYRFLSFCILFFTLFSCNNSEEQAIDKITEGEAEDITIKYAEHFTLEETDINFILQIFDPESGEIDAEFTIDKSRKQKIIGLTTSLYGMLSVLNSTDQLVGITSSNYLYNPKLIEQFNKGQLTAFGDETNYSIEKVIASEGNTVLYSGFGDDFPNRAKLEKFNFLILPIYDWRETHPLGKAEWIKVVGALVGKEKEACAYFDQIEAQYEEVKLKASEFTNNPKVMSGNLFADIWYSPGGESYMAQLIKDAGGNYIYAEDNSTGSIERSIEEILVENEATDIWINPGLTSLEQIINANPHSKHLKAIDNVYCYSLNMNKFWERGAIEPHLLLIDLIQIFHPDSKGQIHYEFYSKID